MEGGSGPTGYTKGEQQREGVGMYPQIASKEFFLCDLC